jgi:hypothetical protein
MGQDRDDLKTMAINVVRIARSHAAMCADRSPFTPDS